jgi:glucose-6-phosphate 1-dehydrogenase
MACSLIIFGGTGDLAHRKLIPSLYGLFRAGRISECQRIWGVSRRPMSLEEYRESMREAVREFGAGADDPAFDEFARILSYHSGDATDADEMHQLDAALTKAEGPDGGDRLYYLAMVPAVYPVIVNTMVECGMSQERPGGPRRRVVVEKPFGHDQASAKELNAKLYRGFEESQIFRIDHYLGKETVQNIYVLRFANTIFEPVWNREHVDSVQIMVAESLGVEHRAAYYEKAGIVRDMFQSHLLQVLSLVAMEPPAKFEAELWRNEKVKLLTAVRDFSPADIGKVAVRGQYEGYREEPGVAPDSRAPTFAAAIFHIDNWRWQGVPFYIRSGKKLERRRTEVTIRFKRPPVKLFDAMRPEDLSSDYLSMCIQPEEAIHLRFETKVPEAGFEMRASQFDYHYRTPEEAANAPDDYERLLMDALRGDQSLFARADEIERAWQIVDPIVEGFEGPGAPPLEPYAPGSWGPAAADELIGRSGRRWILGCGPHPTAC